MEDVPYARHATVQTHPAKIIPIMCETKEVQKLAKDANTAQWGVVRIFPRGKIRLMSAELVDAEQAIAMVLADADGLLMANIIVLFVKPAREPHLQVVNTLAMVRKTQRGVKGATKTTKDAMAEAVA